MTTDPTTTDTPTDTSHYEYARAAFLVSLDLIERAFRRMWIEQAANGGVEDMGRSDVTAASRAMLQLHDRFLLLYDKQYTAETMDELISLVGDA